MNFDSYVQRQTLVACFPAVGTFLHALLNVISVPQTNMYFSNYWEGTFHQHYFSVYMHLGLKARLIMCILEVYCHLGGLHFNG